MCTWLRVSLLILENCIHLRLHSVRIVSFCNTHLLLWHYLVKLNEVSLYLEHIFFSFLWSHEPFCSSHRFHITFLDVCSFLWCVSFTWLAFFFPPLAVFFLFFFFFSFLVALLNWCQVNSLAEVVQQLISFSTLNGLVFNSLVGCFQGNALRACISHFGHQRETRIYFVYSE